VSDIGLRTTVFQVALKSTLIFLFVRGIQVASGVVRNKVGALLLGPFGIGIFGIYMNSINLVQKISSLGISEVAMRDISEVRDLESDVSTTDIISIVKTLSVITGFAGLLLMVSISPLLSIFYFDSHDYIVDFILISFVVFFNIVSEGNFAILKGLREIKYFSRANIILSLLSCLLVGPFYYYFGLSGIVRLMLVTSAATFLTGRFYLGRLGLTSRKIRLSDFKPRIFSMLRIGLSVVFVSCLGLLFEMVVISYLASNLGANTVGYYFAGYSVVVTYFGLIMNSIGVDFYPRISSKLNDVSYLRTELNEQSKIGLLMVYPLVILLIYFSHDIIELLFNINFALASRFVDFAVFGAVLMIVSNNSGMLIIAKKLSKVYIVISILHRAFLLVIYFVLFEQYSFIGLGIGYAVNGLLQLTIYEIVTLKYFSIRHNRENYLLLLCIFLSACFTFFLRSLDQDTAINCDLYFLLFFLSVATYCIYTILKENRSIHLSR